MNKELELALDILRPVTYVVSEEEDKVIRDIHGKTKNDSEIFIYRQTRGMVGYNDYSEEAEKKDAGKGNKGISQVLDEIYSSSPTDKRYIYVLLDVDHYLTGTSDGSQAIVRKLKDIIMQTYRDQVCLKSIVIVSSQLTIPSKLQRYIEVVHYNLPDSCEIKDKVSGVLKDYNSTIERNDKKFNTNISESLVRGFKGLTMFEIEQIVLASIKKFGDLDLKAVEDYKRSVLRKTNVLEMLDTDVSFDEVGGMDNLKRWLQVRGGAWTEEGIKQGVPLLKGLLLLGITGCGKSLVSRAIAHHWGLPLVLFNPSRVFSARVGESENNMLKVLKIVESISPCVMFIDEIEKQFAGSQSSSFSDAGTTSRVIGSFLTWYQDNTSPIFVVATCNHAEYLPAEMVSRFDDKFFVNIPSLPERKSIFEIQLDKYYPNWRKGKINLDDLAKASSQMTGREIEQIIKSSIHEKFYDGSLKGKEVPYSQDHILRVVNAKVPVIKTMQDEINYLVQWIGWDDKKKEGIRANWANKRNDVDDDIDTMLNGILNSDEDYVNKKKRK